MKPARQAALTAREARFPPLGLRASPSARAAFVLPGMRTSRHCSRFLACASGTGPALPPEAYRSGGRQSQIGCAPGRDGRSAGASSRHPACP
eukprot:10051982-Lingulodinium_polyedra.AAC.1